MRFIPATGKPTGKASEAPAAETGVNPYRGTDDANADLLLKKARRGYSLLPPVGKMADLDRNPLAD